MKVLVLCFLVMFNYAALAVSKRVAKNMNPDMSVTAMFLSQDSQRDSDEDGMKLQELEMQFSHDVDAYFKAWVLLAVEQEEGEYKIEPEEAYVETTSLPYVTMKLGKSKMPIGKENLLHSHAYQFINGAMINEEILGEEGLSETGIGLSGILPISWFSEISLFHVQGDNDELFNSERKNSKVFVGKWKNLWDLSDSTTLELGVSGASGENEDLKQTKIMSYDLTVKWRPVVGGKYTSFEWGAEYLERDREDVDTKRPLAGYQTYLKYQFKQRWYTSLRYDIVEKNDVKNEEEKKRTSALLAFVPSEFSAIRAQYEVINDDEDEDEKRISLQFIMSIGAHPAHAY